ncbi:50S ribosomal protein L9 [Lentisphaerota bacterium WC36G]|nr:50S ribosomal protein L9 [Lentisphaerae bacterium WC36]
MASVKLILLEDVDNLGLAGQEVRVAAGYARNYLIPKDLATKASAGALRRIEARKEQIEAARKKALEAAEALAAKVNEAEVSITMQASEDNVLFGSVTARMIAEKLAEQDINVDHNAIKLDDHIKELGNYEVVVKLHSQVTATVKVWVVRG